MNVMVVRDVSITRHLGLTQFQQFWDSVRAAEVVSFEEAQEHVGDNWRSTYHQSNLLENPEDLIDSAWRGPVNWRGDIYYAPEPSGAHRLYGGAIGWGARGEPIGNQEVGEVYVLQWLVPQATNGAAFRFATLEGDFKDGVYQKLRAQRGDTVSQEVQRNVDTWHYITDGVCQDSLRTWERRVSDRADTWRQTLLKKLNGGDNVYTFLYVAPIYMRNRQNTTFKVMALTTSKIVSPEAAQFIAAAFEE